MLFAPVTVEAAAVDLLSLVTGADTCCNGGGKRLGGMGLAVLLPLPRLLADLRAAASSAFCFASASACCAIAAQVLSLIIFQSAIVSAALANSVSLILYLLFATELDMKLFMVVCFLAGLSILNYLTDNKIKNSIQSFVVDTKDKVINFEQGNKTENQQVVFLEKRNIELQNELTRLTNLINSMPRAQNEPTIIHVNGQATMCQVSPVQIKVAGINTLNIDCPQ